MAIPLRILDTLEDCAGKQATWVKTHTNASDIEYANVAIPTDICHRTFHRGEHYTLATANIFGWGYCFFFLMGLKRTGPYILMIIKMVKSDITLFLSVYGVFLLMFAQTFQLVLSGREGFWPLVRRIRDMMTSSVVGMVEQNRDNQLTSSISIGLERLFLVIWLLLVPVLLLNLVIAMMSSTYETFLSEATERWWLERANILQAIEDQV